MGEEGWVRRLEVSELSVRAFGGILGKSGDVGAGTRWDSGASRKEAGGMCSGRKGIKEAVENRIWGAILGCRGGCGWESAQGIPVGAGNRG